MLPVNDDEDVVTVSFTDGELAHIDAFAARAGSEGRSMSRSEAVQALVTYALLVSTTVTVVEARWKRELS